MVSNYVEKEIKLRINDLGLLINKLTTEKAVFIGKALQRTVRFDNQENSLESNGTFLRVRSGFENVITVKRKVKDDSGDVFKREEFETRVDDIEMIRKMLNALGFNREYVMEKYRMEWELDGVNISIDELPFGFFVEIEGEEKKIFEVAQKLNLDVNERIIVTYWDIFAEYKKEYDLIGENIEFERDHKSVIDKIFIPVDK
jgi:adenylate cyclase class 2